MVASAALSGDLERLKDIFESDDCSIFIQRPGVEEANLPDVLEHWTLREYVELALLPAATGSSRRHNLHSVLLCMEGRESMEAFDFAFGPMKENDLDALRTLTLKGKAFHVFSFQQWKSQLQLIEGCYRGQKNVVSELLNVGAPDEISPCLHSRRSEFLITRGCLPGLCALCWRLVFFQDWLRASGRRLFWSVGDCSESGNMIACCRFIILPFFFGPCKCDL